MLDIPLGLDPDGYKPENPRKFAHAPLPRVEIVASDTPSGRVYTLPSGERYFSVTTRIGQYKGDPEWLTSWAERVGADEARRVSQRATSRGTEAHAACEAYVRNLETLGDLSYLAVEDFERIKPVLDGSLGVVYGVEHPVFSRELKTAGRADLIAEWDGVPSVIDFKTAGSWAPTIDEENLLGYFIQESAYAYCVEEMTGNAVPQIVTIMLRYMDSPVIFTKRPEEYLEHVVSVFSAISNPPE